MDSFELNKIVGAALTALLLIFGVKTFIEISQAGHGAGHHAIGYKLPVEVASAASGAVAAAPAAALDVAKVMPLVVKASVDSGQATFKKCASCHTPNKGGKNAVGPNLWGVVERAKASVEGFAYSESAKAQAGSKWTYENLAKFLNNPKGYMPGTKMAFNGIAEPEELAELLAYLRTLADSPAAPPK